MVCLGGPYHFKFFKRCLPKILLRPFFEYFVPFLSALLFCHQVRSMFLADRLVENRTGYFDFIFSFLDKGWKIH